MTNQIGGKFTMVLKLWKQDVPVYVGWTGHIDEGENVIDEINVELEVVSKDDGDGWPAETVSIELWDILDGDTQDIIQKAIAVDART